MDEKITALFISSYDSTNYVFVNLILEMKRRGHTCIVLVKDVQDTVNNKMYSNAQIPIGSYADFDAEALDTVDVVFASPLKLAGAEAIWKQIEKRGIFVISFANLFSSVTMRVYTDLIFTIGTAKFAEMRENGLCYSMVAVGNPQYDELIVRRKAPAGKTGIVDLGTIHKILFVEQGGYPFGAEGKQLLGRTLIAMAEKHPDKEIIVKPRFLPGDDGELLHRPSEHIYEFIPNPPKNLILLRENTFLEELILQVDAVATMWSTAFLDAALLGLPLMLIHGLPSVNVFDVTNQRVEEAYEELSGSGCVVEYRDILEGKLDFSYVNPDFLQAEVENVDAPCAPKAVDLVEAVYEHLIRTGKRLALRVELTADAFLAQLSQLETIDAKSTAYRNRRAFLRFLNTRMQQLVFDNRCMGRQMKLDSLQKYWDVGYKRPLGTLTRKWKVLWVWIHFAWAFESFFAPWRMKKETDPVRLEFYMYWLYRTKRYRRILSFDNPQVLPETMFFYHAMIALKKRQYELAAEQYAAYYKASQACAVKILRIDRRLEVRFLPKGEELEAFLAALAARGEHALADLIRAKRMPGGNQ